MRTFDQPPLVLSETIKQVPSSDLPDPPGNRSIPLLAYANSSFLLHWSPVGEWGESVRSPRIRANFVLSGRSRRSFIQYCHTHCRDAGVSVQPQSQLEGVGSGRGAPAPGKAVADITTTSPFCYTGADFYE